MLAKKAIKVQSSIARSKSYGVIQKQLEIQITSYPVFFNGLTEEDGSFCLLTAAVRHTHNEGKAAGIWIILK